MRLNADVGGVLDGRDFGRRLLDAQLGDERGGVGDLAKRITRVELRIGDAGGVDVFVRGERLVKLAFEFFHRQDVFKASGGLDAGIFRRPAPAVITLRHRVVVRQEEDLSRRCDKQSGAGFRPASQVIEVRFLREGEDRIAALGLPHHQQSAIQRFPQGRPPRAELLSRHFGKHRQREGQEQQSGRCPIQTPILP